MALREIFFVGNPVLREKSKTVKKVDNYICRLLDDMLETMRHADGIGLAAPQVGVLRRVVVIEHEETIYDLINPEIIQAEGAITDVEGCLSIPGRAGMVERPEKVTVRAMGRDGQMHTYSGEGLLARAFCHEIDHLNGRLYIDIMIEEVDLSKREEGESDTETAEEKL